MTTEATTPGRWRGIDVEVSGDGVPLVWAHAGLENRAAEDRLGLFSWRGLEGVRLVRFDAPGHGGSRPAAAGDLSMRSMGRGLVSIGRWAAGESFVVGGRSMGATAAVWAATLSPARVRALLVVMPHTSWGYRARHGPGGALASLAGSVQTDGPDALATVIAQQAPPAALAGLGTTLRQPIVDSVRAMDRQSLLHVITASRGWQLPPREQVAALRMPALIVALAGDPAHPAEVAEELAAALSDAQLIIARDEPEVRALRARVRSFVIAAP